MAESILTSLTYEDRLSETFDEAKTRLLESDAMKALASGEATPEQYRSVIREVFHYARENPQLHATASLYFRGRQRRLVGAMLKHAAAELGHEDLALNDFAALGGDPAPVPYENPLPETAALTAFAYSQIHYGNAVGFIGYVYFLEFMATHVGPFMVQGLKAIGVPDNALTFLRDHAEIDVAHNRIMKMYIEGLVTDEPEFESVSRAITTTGMLYGNMMNAAVADSQSPSRRGWNWLELNADRVTPADIAAGRGSAAVA